MEKDVIGKCVRMSFADTPFPEVVRQLGAAGVRAYHADLINLRNAYYGDGNDSYDHALPLSDGPAIATDFRETDVAAAVRAIHHERVLGGGRAVAKQFQLRAGHSGLEANENRFDAFHADGRATG